MAKKQWSTLELASSFLVLALELEAGLQVADLHFILDCRLSPFVQFGGDNAQVSLQGGDLSFPLGGGGLHGVPENQDLLLGAVQLLAGGADSVLSLLTQSLHIRLELRQLS